MFSVPFIIGTGAKVDVLSVYIFRLLDTYPPQMALALTLAGLMLLVVQVLLILQRVLMPAGRHAAIGGRGLRLGRFELGAWRHGARGLAAMFMIVTSVLPVVGLAIVSLQPFWTPAIRWRFLSFKNYSFVLLENALTSRALMMSLMLGVAVATFAMIVVGLIMLHAHQRRGAGLRFADTITNLPATIPHTVIGVSFIIAFAVPPFRLYGTALILFLAYVAMALPAAARAASSAASGIGHELGEASRVFRASETRTFARILFPLALPGLIAGWIIIFIHTAGEVTASSLLGGTGNPVIGRVLMELWSFGSFPQVAALSLIITAVNATLVFAMLRFTRHGFERGR
jgi:iron(III) transport system permease protein